MAPFAVDRRELVEAYASLSDEELLCLFNEHRQLTLEARAALAVELSNRGLAPRSGVKSNEDIVESDQVAVAGALEPSASDWERAKCDLRPPPAKSAPKNEFVELLWQICVIGGTLCGIFGAPLDVFLLISAIVVVVWAVFLRNYCELD